MNTTENQLTTVPRADALLRGEIAHADVLLGDRPADALPGVGALLPVEQWLLQLLQHIGRPWALVALAPAHHGGLLAGAHGEGGGVRQADRLQVPVGALQVDLLLQLQQSNVIQLVLRVVLLVHEDLHHVEEALSRVWFAEAVLAQLHLPIARVPTAQHAVRRSQHEVVGDQRGAADVRVEPANLQRRLMRKLIRLGVLAAEDAVQADVQLGGALAQLI